jgi:hypothetical protein
MRLTPSSRPAAPSGYKPTNQHAEVQVLLNGELREHLVLIDRLLDRELAAFNAMLEEFLKCATVRGMLKERRIPNVMANVIPRSTGR